MTLYNLVIQQLIIVGYQIRRLRVTLCPLFKCTQECHSQFNATCGMQLVPNNAELTELKKEKRIDFFMRIQN